MGSKDTGTDPIADAWAAIAEYVTKITGTASSNDEIARALKRYFVLKEITDHIIMEREGGI